MTHGRGDSLARDIVNRACAAPVAVAPAAGSARPAAWGGVTEHPYFSVKPVTERGSSRRAPTWLTTRGLFVDNSTPALEDNGGYLRAAISEAATS